MNYFGVSINQSPTIAEQAGAAILVGEFLVVKYDNDGKVIVCDTEGEKAVGILVPETSKEIQINDDVTIQIKDIGMGMSGAKIVKGDELMVDNKGRLIPATSGKFILGYAMSSAEGENQHIQVDIRKSGYKA